MMPLANTPMVPTTIDRPMVPPTFLPGLGVVRRGRAGDAASGSSGGGGAARRVSSSTTRCALGRAAGSGAHIASSKLRNAVGSFGMRLRSGWLLASKSASGEPPAHITASVMPSP